MPAPILQFKRGSASALNFGLRAGEPALTTDKYDFYVGIDSTLANNKFFGSARYWTKETTSTGSGINLVEGTTNGTQYITLKSPDNLSGIGTYTFPDTSTITDGYFLKVASNGTLSWDTVGGTSGTFTNPTLSGITTVSGSFFDVNTDSDFSGITTFSNITNNTLGNSNTGSVQIDGGLGVDKNVTVGAGLSVNGNAYVVGILTSIEYFVDSTAVLLSDISAGITLAGIQTIDAATKATLERELAFAPNDFNSLNVSGISTFGGTSNFNGLVSIANTTQSTDKDTGALVIEGGLGVEKDVHIGGSLNGIGNVNFDGDLNVDGVVTIGGTVFFLTSQEVYIKNKDIVLGYTTSPGNVDISDDDTANHAGVAIASTVGSPLVPFTASGINTLPDTYKQMMWFKSGTLGFGTDTFAFNYGVAIGTTQMSDGVRLAVGTGVSITDTEVIAPTGTFGTLTGSLTGTISTATRATTVDTTGTSDNATYYVTFADTSGGQNGETLRVGTALSLNASTGNVKSAGDLIAGSGYLSAPDGAQSIFMYSGSGDVLISSNLTVNGTLTGTASTATTLITQTASDTNATYHLTFVDSHNASQTPESVYTDAGIFYNPGTNTFTTQYITATADVIVGTSLSAPTIKTATVQHSGGTTAATIDSLGSIVASKDLTVTGNLYVNGNTTQVNVTELEVYDRTITLGIQSGTTPTSTSWDLGVMMNYGDAGVAKTAAVIWEHTAQRFKFASSANNPVSTGSTTTPDITVNTFAPIEVAELWVNNTCSGGAVQVIGCINSELNLQNIVIDAGSF
jgi:hypothetical protein